MSEILLVGSAGFIGSNIANYLVQHSTKTISSIDSLQGVPHLRNIQPALQSKNRHVFYLAKAEDNEIRNKILELEKPETVVYNLGSYQLRNINSENQWQHIALLQSWVADCAKWGVKRIVILLDHTVLYDKLNVHALEYANICEQYAIGSQDIDIYTVVPSYVYGPRQGMSSDISRVIKQCFSTQDYAPVFSSKAFDMIYIKDYFWAVDQFIQGKGKPGLWQILGYEAASLRTAYWYLVNIRGGREPTNLYDGDPIYKNNFISEPQTLSWEPAYQLGSALEHTLCWYDANRWAWETK